MVSTTGESDVFTIRELTTVMSYDRAGHRTLIKHFGVFPLLDALCADFKQSQVHIHSPISAAIAIANAI